MLDRRDQDLKPYPDYRDSGLPWLGRVPAHWDVRRAKYLFRCIDVRSTSGEEELLTVSAERSVVPRSSMKVTMFKAESYVGHKLCWPNDLVINSLWAWGRGLGVTKHHGIISSAYGVYRLRSGFEALADFIHHLVRSAAFHWELRVRSKGVWISRLQLTDDAFLNAPIPLPPVDEAEAAVRFISMMDRRVNRFIRNRRRLIEVLNEQKQAIINRVVTRGLDPNAPLKPSGIDWLGDIPEHWEVSRLKLYLVRNDGGVWGSGFSDEGTIVLRSTEQTVDGQWRIVDPARRTLTEQECSSAILAEGDLLVTKSSGSPAHIGKTTLVTADIAADGCCFSNFMQRLRPDQRLIPRFAWRVLNSILARRQLQYLSNSTTGLGNLSSSILGNIWVAVPPTGEQDDLLDLLDAELHPFEQAIATAKREIDLIREYRTRLIADVVTGKLDVRNFAPAPQVEEVQPEDLEPLDGAEEVIEDERQDPDVAELVEDSFDD